MVSHVLKVLLFIIFLASIVLLILMRNQNIAVLLPIAGLIVAIVGATYPIYADIKKLQIEQSLEPKHYLKDRAQLIEDIRLYYIENVLEASLVDTVYHDLKLEHRPDDIQNSVRVVMQKKKDEVITNDKSIQKVFEEANGRLLITGAPGAGKTTLLLRLARRLIREAKRHSDRPFPVIFNLSGWTEKHKHLEDWLINELKARYGVHPAIGTTWINQQQIIILLDGLDEVPTKHQSSCLAHINAFRKAMNRTQIVVCSRREEFNIIVQNDPDNRIFFSDSIELKPLTDKQVNNYLSYLGNQVQSLKNMLKQDDALKEMSKIPLLLNMMILAYYNMPLDDIPQLESAEKRQTHIFDTYTQRRFALIDHSKRDYKQFGEKNTLAWLKWLAWNMKKKTTLSTFYIEELQPTWLSWRDQNLYQLRYHRFVTRFSGLVAGLVTGMPLIILGILNGRILEPIIIGVFAGTITGVHAAITATHKFRTNYSRTHTIRPVDILYWQWNRVKFQLFPPHRVSEIALMSMPGAALGAAAIGFFGGIISWILCIVAGWLLGGIAAGFDQRESVHKTAPNDSIIASFKNWIRFSLIMGISTTFIFWILGSIGAWILQIDEYIVITIAVYAGLMMSLYIGIYAHADKGFKPVSQHYILRHMLHQKYQLPIRKLPDFLIYAKHLRLMIQVGGGFKFMHSLLQDYFADLYEQENSPNRS